MKTKTTTYLLAALAACFLAAPCATAQRAVQKIAGTNALIEPLATGAKTFTTSAAGGQVWENGATFTGGSYFRAAAGLAIGTDVQGFDADLTTFAGITPSANVQSLLAAVDYAAMRGALGLVIGTNVQGYDADLTTFSGITPSANVQSLLTAVDYAAMRTALGLVIGTNVQGYDADLDTYAGIAPSATIQSLLGAANGTAARAALGLTINTNVQAYDGDLITWSSITPSSNVQTFIAAGTFPNMRSALGVAIGTDVQHWDADLDVFAGITPSANVQSLLGAADYAAMRGALGLVIGTNVQAYNANTSLLGSSIDLASEVTGALPESSVSFTDITTGNASTSKHGYLPKLDGNAAHYLDGTGALSSPPSGLSTAVIAQAMEYEVASWWYPNATGSGSYDNGRSFYGLVRTGSTASSTTAMGAPQGQGLGFNCFNDASHDLDWGKKFAISTWIRITARSTNGQVWVQFGRFAGGPSNLSQKGIGIRVNDLTLTAQAYDSGLTTSATLATLTTGANYHVMIVNNADGTAELFIDGSSVGTIAGVPTTQEGATFWGYAVANNADASNTELVFGHFKFAPLE